MSEQQFQIIVVGHVTKDVINIPEQPTKVQVGGTVHYAAVALRSLGSHVGAVTRVAKHDDSLLDEMRAAGIHVHSLESDVSTVMENTYEDPALSVRHQRVQSIATPFVPSDLQGIRARVVQLGPLSNAEMSPEFIAKVARSATLVGLDVQGFTRIVIDQRVTLGSCPHLAELLRPVHVIKADDTEACVLTGCKDVRSAALKLQSMGPREILITFADRGSLILDGEGHFHEISAYPPARTVDATGCGDTYFASYLFWRLRATDAAEAGRFASAAASIKLESGGPFRGTIEDVLTRAGLHRQ